MSERLQHVRCTYRRSEISPTPARTPRSDTMHGDRMHEARVRTHCISPSVSAQLSVLYPPYYPLLFKDQPSGLMLNYPPTTIVR